jgi:hypothetical protein
LGKFTVFVVCCVQVSISAPHGLGRGVVRGGGGLEKDSINFAYANRSIMFTEFALGAIAIGLFSCKQGHILLEMSVKSKYARSRRL